MAKKIDEIKNELVGDVFSFEELENCMKKHGFLPAESEVEILDIQEDKTKKKRREKTGCTHAAIFVNDKNQIWLYGNMDENRCMLVLDVTQNNRVYSEPTRVEPFRSYEDLCAVLKWFYDNKKYDEWFIGWLMTSLGRRVGDTVSLKWSDLYTPGGEYRERLTTLKEEKTGKIVGVRFNKLAQSCVEEYCDVMKINPMEHYREQIFNISENWFRKQVKCTLEKCEIKYPISTHSFRKFYASTIYKMHPQDLDRLTVVQTMLGHSDPEKTKLYINEIDEKVDKYNLEYAEYMLKKRDGIAVEISNSPVISFKVETFRKILSLLFDLAVSGKEKFEAIDEVLGFAESNRI